MEKITNYVNKKGNLLGFLWIYKFEIQHFRGTVLIKKEKK